MIILQIFATWPSSSTHPVLLSCLHPHKPQHVCPLGEVRHKIKRIWRSHFLSQPPPKKWVQWLLGLLSCLIAFGIVLLSVETGNCNVLSGSEWLWFLKSKSEFYWSSLSTQLFTLFPLPLSGWLRGFSVYCYCRGCVCMSVYVYLCAHITGIFCKADRGSIWNENETWIDTE